MTVPAAKGRVNVFARVRPGVAREDGDQHCVDMNTDLHKCVVRMHDGDAVERVLAGGSAAPSKVMEKEFTFDGVFDPDSNQKEVYEEVGKPVLKDVLQGYNGSILAYGQAGGKAHSLLNSGMGVNGKPDRSKRDYCPASSLRFSCTLELTPGTCTPWRQACSRLQRADRLPAWG